MPKPAAIVYLFVALLFTPRIVHPQTLDELQHPLLAKGAATVSADYGAFAFESESWVFGTPPSTFYEPAHYVLLPTARVGIARNIQVAVSAAYLFPTLQAYPVFCMPVAFISVTRSLTWARRSARG